MVGMGMRNEHMAECCRCHARFFELGEYAVASAGIDQKGGGVCVQSEAGVVTARNGCVACAEYRKFFHSECGYICQTKIILFE